MTADAPSAPAPPFRPWATRAILLALGVMFVLELATGSTTSTVTLFHLGANHATSVRAGQVWRLLSSAFLHVGPLHLFVNGMALNAFGPLLELVLGRARFLLLYALAALGGGLGTFAMADERISAGASGALWGLMGAELALGFAGDELLADDLRRALRRGGARLLGLNLLISLLPGIDLAAHLGGGIVGALLVGSRLLTRGRRAELARRDWWGAPMAKRAAVLAWAVVVAAVVAGVVQGRPWDVRRPPDAWREVVLPGSTFALEVPPTFRLVRVQAHAPWGLAYVAGNLARQPLKATLYLQHVGRRQDPRAFAAAVLAAARSPREVSGGILRDARLVTLAGGRPAVALTYAPVDDTTRLAWIALVDGAQVRVDVLVRSDAAPAWRAAAGRFMASLRRVS